MPKLKTHKGTAKRINITGTGKLIRGRASGNHMLSKEQGSQESYKTTAVVRGAMAQNVKRALGI